MKAKLSIVLLAFLMLVANLASAQSWNLTGNAPTTPGVHFLGTTDANDLVFKVGGVERMRLVNSPAAPRWCRLTVNGTIGSTGTSAGFLMFNRQTDQPSSQWYSPTPGETRLYDHLTGTNRIVVKSNGDIGIGTDNPGGHLHIHNGILRLTGSDPNYGGPMIVLGGTPVTGPAANGQWGMEYEPNARGLNFWRPFQATNGSGTGSAPYMNYVMFLSDENRVGINTNNPTADLTVNGRALIGSPTTPMPGNYKLFVQGGILTEQVKVAVIGTSGWADYVFSPSYQLRSLAEVEAYIKENQHLPGVSSASELETEGLDLGAMQAIQMEKIEELTLYLIELEKKIARLETQNPVLKIDNDTTNN
jgi:hypothetical protein